MHFLRIDIPSLQGSLSTSWIRLHQSVQSASEACCQIADSFLAVNQNFDPTSLIGEDALVKASVDDDGSSNNWETVFEGVITAAQNRYVNGEPVIQFWIRAQYDQLGHSKSFRVFTQKNLGAIIDKVEEQSGCPIRNSGFTNESCGPLVVQCMEDDISFLRRIAHGLGGVCFYDGVKWQVDDWEKAGSGRDVKPQDVNRLELKYQTAPKSLSLRHRAEQADDFTQNTTIAVNTGSPSARALLNGGASIFSNPIDVLHNYHTLGLGEASRLAMTPKTLSYASTENSVRLEGVSNEIRLNIGELITLSGFSHMRDGETYRCTEVTLSNKNGTYTCSFKATLAERHFVPNPQLSDQSDLVVLGRVTDNKDPEKLGRVKLAFPQAAHYDETPWISVPTSFTAGGGMNFVPAVGDEVLVTNLQNVHLHQQPIILKVLYTNRNTARFEPHFRGWSSGEAGILTNDENGDVIIRGNSLSIVMNEAIEIDAGSNMKLSGDRIDIN